MQGYWYSWCSIHQTPINGGDSMNTVNRCFVSDSDSNIHRIDVGENGMVVQDVVRRAVKAIDEIDDIEYSDEWFVEVPVGYGRMKVYSRKELINSGGYDDILPDE